jgi:hypothetical protein
MTSQGDGVWRDESRLPTEELTAAMATYSFDGQVDDETGNDAGSEEEFGHGHGVTGRPSPEGRHGPG